jgi:hypothetical protein
MAQKLAWALVRGGRFEGVRSGLHGGRSGAHLAAVVAVDVVGFARPIRPVVADALPLLGRHSVCVELVNAEWIIAKPTAETKLVSGRILELV